MTIKTVTYGQIASEMGASGSMQIENGGNSTPKNVKPGLLCSHDGKNPIHFPASALLDAMAAWEYIDAVDVAGNCKAIQRPKRAPREVAPKCDYKVGRVPVFFNLAYRLKGKKGAAYSVTRPTTGRGLLATIVEMRKGGCGAFLLTHLPTGDSAHQKDHGALDYPLQNSAIDAALIAAGLMAEKTTPEFTADGATRIAVWYDRTYTWFTLSVGGVEIKDKAAMFALLGNSYPTSLKTTFGRGSMGFSSSRNAWFIPRLPTDGKIDHNALAQWFDSFPNVGDIELEIRPDAGSEIKTAAAPVASVAQTYTAEQVAAAVAAAIASLTK